MSLRNTVKRDDVTWLVLPDVVEAQLRQWASRFPERYRLLHEPASSGHNVYLADVGQPRESASEVLIVQPHGHEPAASAAIMELLSELITGRKLDGSAADLPPGEILKRCRLAVNPLGNPDGRSRMPTLCWTNEFTREETLYYCNSKARGGTYLSGLRKRVMRVGDIELDSDYPLACRWEHVGDDLYVDPWGWPGDLASNPTTLARLVRPVLAQRRLDLVLDMHQVENDTPQVWVPKFEDPTVVERIAALAGKIEAAWQGAGFRLGERHPYPPSGFIWGLHQDGMGRPTLVTVEIGMGVGQADPQMTPDRQKEAGLIALHTAVQAVLEGER